MALRTTLEEIVEMTRDEARVSSNTSRGTDHRVHIVTVIRRHYRILAENNDWQHLRIVKEDAGKVLEAGARYYDFPATLNLDQPFKAWVKWGSSWHELDFGITGNQYSALDSDANQRSDPVERWAWHGADQFEVWPLPASNGGEVRFDGKKKWNPLNQESDRADLDDTLLSLFSAGALCAENKQKESAEEKFAAANLLLAQLTAAKTSGARVAFGRGEIGAVRARPRHPTNIRG